MHMKMLSAKVVCCIHLLTILTNVSEEANSVDQDQSDLSLHLLTKRLLKHFCRRQNQTTFVVIGALRVKTSRQSYIPLLVHITMATN